MSWHTLGACQASCGLRVPGRGIRLALVTSALVTGLALATVAFPTADHLQDRVSAQIGIDVR